MKTTRQSERTRRSGGETPAVAFRLPKELIARLDRHVERLQEQVPAGVEINRTTAIRTLLTSALDVAERNDR